jgi:hypothetical protein
MKYLLALIGLSSALYATEPSKAPPAVQADVVQAVAAPALANVACIAPEQKFSKALLTDTAQLLAGITLPETSEIANISASAPAKLHQQNFQAAFKKLDERQLNRVKAFAAAELAAPSGITADAPLFYPFSGPDLLYAEAFFPNARRYLLTGLEPVGDMPELASYQNVELSDSLAELRKSLHAILNFSFFKTNDMRVDFRRSKLKGVVPVLLTFAAKAGFEVNNIHFFYVNTDGSVCTTDAKALINIKAPQIPGVELTLQRPGSATTQALIYLSSDIGDTGLAKTPQYTALVQRLGHGATFLKSASFLLHKPYFSKVRQLILDTSPRVLQDDSGVPYTQFPLANWQPIFYGTYVKPIPLFANHYQPKLIEAFKTLGSKPLEFGIGYRYSKRDSSLLLFNKIVTP